MIQGGRRQIDAPVIHIRHRFTQHRHQRRDHRINGLAGKFTHHTLWPPRRTRGIQKVGANRLVIDRAFGQRMHEGLPIAFRISSIPANENSYVRASVLDRGQQLLVFRRHDQHLRCAISDYIADLIRVQMTAYGCIEHARPLRRPCEYNKFQTVLKQQRDVFARLYPQLSKSMRSLIGSAVELPKT